MSMIKKKGTIFVDPPLWQINGNFKSIFALGSTIIMVSDFFFNFLKNRYIKFLILTPDFIFLNSCDFFSSYLFIYFGIMLVAIFQPFHN